MRKRMFGNSGLKTSVIGYGGWPMGRGMYGDFDDDEAISLLYGDISLLTVQLLRSCCLESIGNSLTLVNQIWNAGGTSKEVAEDILNYISDIFQAKY